MIPILYIAICEDDLLQTEIIIAMLEKYRGERPGLDVKFASFNSSESILQAIDSGQEFNIFLLDILLAGMSGIELARILRKKSPNAALIFITSTADYALDAFKVSASQYILKPVKHDELFPVLDNIASSVSKKKERFFLLPTQKSIVKILYCDIVCVELTGRALRFYLENGETFLGRTIRISFIEAISQLLEDGRFLCEHKSFALNMAHIEEIGNNSFKMKCGIEVPIPRYNFANAKAKYFSWVKEQGQLM